MSVAAGKTDQIDAGLAVSAAVRMDTGQLPRRGLAAREEMTTTRTPRSTGYARCY